MSLMVGIVYVLSADFSSGPARSYTFLASTNLAEFYELSSVGIAAFEGLVRLGCSTSCSAS